MLKMAPNFVLGRSSPLDVLLQYASGASLPAALLDDHFEHPEEREFGL
jgi:hypothetical protein